MPKDPTKKPRTLRRKNIKRRTGARAQSKQIMALSKQVSTLTKVNYARIRTVWQRNNLPVGSPGAIVTPYVCPIPYAPCDPLGTSPVPAAQRFADNRQIASQQFFTKRLVFGYPEAAANSNTIMHTGGKLRYTVYTTEPSYTKMTICLVRAKKKQADQLITDRELKGVAAASAAGSTGRLYDDIDYTVHNGAGGNFDTYYGAEINRKYWDVLYKREIALTHPGASNITPNQATPANTNPKNNALVATGSIRLPAAGQIKSVGQLTLQGQSPSNALEQQYVDQRNEDSVYLVAISNDLQIDGENISMGMVVTDYYKAVV